MDHVAGNKAIYSERKRILLAENLWLHYFNRYLYEKDVLTEAERNRMIAKIESRKESSSHNKQKQETHKEARR